MSSNLFTPYEHTDKKAVRIMHIRKKSKAMLRLVRRTPYIIRQLKRQRLKAFILRKKFFAYVVIFRFIDNSTPPFFTSCEDLVSILYCKSGRAENSSVFLYLISGFRLNTPSPEHGTSHITLSAEDIPPPSAALRTAVFIIVIPSLSAVCDMSLVLCG